jgi:hypothetical protein
VNALSDWLTAQLLGPGVLVGLLQPLVLFFVLVLALRAWRSDRRRQYRVERRESDALAAIADHACDLVVAVADALRDEVNAHEFVEQFERRLLIDADLMLDAIPPASLPSLGLLRPLFELRWTVERSLELADWLVDTLDTGDREGWREAAEETRTLAERAAVAADAFRGFAASMS